MEDKKDKCKVFYSLEKCHIAKLNEIAETKGPSVARMVEKKVLEFLKDKHPEPEVIEDEKRQTSFYLDDLNNEKLALVAKEEGRSVSNLVAWLVKKELIK